MIGHNYTISGGFAHREKLPVVFRAATLAETAKAIYLYGGASIEYARRTGRCCRCGRLLTHPGSIVLGIGPECLGDWGLRDVVFSALSKEEIMGLSEKIRAMQSVDGWIPKGVILGKESSSEDIFVPSDHPMIRTATIEKIGGELKVKFPYDPKKVEAIRTITGKKRWDSDTKTWTLPHTEQTVAVLKKIGLEAPEAAPPPVVKRSAINLQGFGRQLMPFQREGLEFLHAKNGRALIGDSMGLGKTIQALAYVHTRPDLRPALVVCPASLKLNWAREASVACPDIKTHIISGTSLEALPPADLYIINYDILPDKREKKTTMGPQGPKKVKVPIPETGWWNYLTHCKLMIIDEAHYLKGNNTFRTKDILGRGAKNKCLGAIPHIVALTGTPILNRPVEIYPVAKALAPNDIPPFMTFAHKYCGAKHNGFGWDFTGSSNTEELHGLLTTTIMIRRTKTEVLKDLPEKTRSVVPMEVGTTAMREYEQARAHFLEWLKTVDPEKVSTAQRAEVLVQFQTLKRLAVRGKWDATIDWLKDALDTNGKMLVFAVHHEAVDGLMSALKDYIPVKVDGRDSQEARQNAVDRFQNDPACRVFVGNIKAAGVGLTLTEASAVAFVELGWTPGEHVQSEDRAHRIGQKKAVNIYYLIASGTIEEDIAALLDNKQKVLDAVLDGTGAAQESLLTELLNKYRNENKKG
jgi:SWI/SNF-related matrix-associated actin-dependent regulator of chromatin subfamily A-like protein 1